MGEAFQRGIVRGFRRECVKQKENMRGKGGKKKGLEGAWNGHKVVGMTTEEWNKTVGGIPENNRKNLAKSLSAERYDWLLKVRDEAEDLLLSVLAKKNNPSEDNVWWVCESVTRLSNVLREEPKE